MNPQTERIQAFHEGTKHPYGRLFDLYHQYDPRIEPRTVKRYPGALRLPLAVDTTPVGVSALEAVGQDPPEGAEGVPDLATLTRVLHFTGGITKRLRFPGLPQPLPFRAAACTGALYHIELYLVCGDLPGLEAGVYHFDPEGPALERLRRGDLRGVLLQAAAGEAALARAPAVLIFTDAYWRNAYKYQARAYRHTFWDSGTMVANALAMASAHRLAARVVLGFVDAEIDRLLGLEAQPEFSVALLPLGAGGSPPPAAPADLPPLEARPEPVRGYRTDYPPILDANAASSLRSAEEVAAWRAPSPRLCLPEPAGSLRPLQPPSPGQLPSDPLEQVIRRRGSARRFRREPISAEVLATVLARSYRPLPTDADPRPPSPLNHLYLIVNAVEGVPAGAYVYHPQRQALEQLKEGCFRRQAGFLALNQALAADAAAALFYLVDLEPVLEAYGNRGYRLAQLEASVAAGRAYLAAYALRLGATGLTFFDDAVTEFFSPHAAGKAVMFLLAVGLPGRRG